jgi:hypothetical protein
MAECFRAAKSGLPGDPLLNDGLKHAKIVNISIMDCQISVMSVPGAINILFLTARFPVALSYHSNIYFHAEKQNFFDVTLSEPG